MIARTLGIPYVKILTAIDGSKHSAWALDLLLRLPLSVAPHLQVLHVMEQAMLTQSWLARPLASQPATETRKRSKAAARLVRRAVAKLRRRAKSVRPLLQKGPVTDTIVTTAAREKADLLVLGSRGISNIQAFLMGSVSQQVATYAPCSVLIVKERARAVTRVLLAVDGSSASKRAMAFLPAHLKPAGVTVIVLMVRDDPYPEASPVNPRIEQYQHALLRAGFSVQLLTATGHAAATIISTARRQRADLIVLGSRGLTGLKRFLLGSVSRQVTKYAPCSVLVVRGH